jgi:hypothetical protein
VEQQLPLGIVQLTRRHANGEFAHRLEQVCDAAVHAIARLSELDLVKYEESPLEASADLSLWETVAPVVGSTIADVNALLENMRARFPESEIVIDPTENEIDRLVQQALSEMHAKVIAFGMQIRDPSVVGDRWNLAGELQRVRSLFRERIGLFLFESMQQLGDCRRAEVDPSYVEAVKSALLIRSTGADLNRLMTSRIVKVSEAEAQDVPWHAEQIVKELDAFGRTSAWRALQAPQKKAVLEFKNSILSLAKLNASQQAELLSLLIPFAEVVSGFLDGSSQALLQQHDQEVRAEVGVSLERALSLEVFEEAASAFEAAVGKAQALYGRNGEFDTFLRKVKRTVPSRESLQAEVEVFLLLLSAAA